MGILGKVIAYEGYFYFVPDAAVNFLERGKLGATFPHPFPSIVAKLGLK